MVRIAVDMDEVIADFIAKQLRLFNAANGTEYGEQDLAGTKLRLMHPEKAESIQAMVSDESYFADLPVMEGAKEARDLYYYRRNGISNLIRC